MKDKLINEALEAQKNAYAPYSKFKVGAAILTETGNVYKGCNVENASLGASICAERNAATTALAQEGKVRFQAIAIASTSEDPAPPCGICRQFLSEFTDTEAPVYLVSAKSGKTKEFSFGKLMPESLTEF